MRYIHLGDDLRVPPMLAAGKGGLLGGGSPIALVLQWATSSGDLAVPPVISTTEAPVKPRLVASSDTVLADVRLVCICMVTIHAAGGNHWDRIASR